MRSDATKLNKEKRSITTKPCATLFTVCMLGNREFLADRSMLGNREFLADRKEGRVSTINRAETKKTLLAMSQSFRNGKFTRVSKSALDELEARHQAAMRDLVHRQPSKGKTITTLW